MGVHSTYKNPATFLAHCHDTYGYLTYWLSMNMLDNVFVFSLLGLC